jgi:hypothetical protein
LAYEKKEVGGMETITLVVAINRFFGKKEGQTFRQFSAEIKRLTPKDRKDLAEMLSRAMGVVVEVKE